MWGWEGKTEVIFLKREKKNHISSPADRIS